MPAPTGVSIVIDGGNATTNDLDVVLTIAATDADEMAFSNDGVTFSPFEVFGTSKSFNLSDFNGGSAEGIRRVTVKVRDTFDNAETTAFDEILFEVPEPRIEFDVESIDLGLVPIADVTNTRFAFRNTGDGPLEIADVRVYALEGC